MTTWEKQKLGNLIKIRHGYAFKGEYFSDLPSSNILLTPGNFAIGGGFQLNKPKFYNGPVPEDFILKAGDLVVTMTDLSKKGDTLGYPAIIPNLKHANLLHNQRIGLVSKNNPNIDLRFLYYLLRTQKYQKFIVGSASGATVHHTSPNRIYEYIVDIPNLEIQSSIAKVLSAYDDLIENNEKRIKVLDEMVQRLFAEWFINLKFPGYEKINMIAGYKGFGFIPESWEIKKLVEVSEYISRGISPRYDDDADCTVINQKCIRNKNLNLEQARSQNKPVSVEKQIKLGDVLINSTGVGTLGRVTQVYDNYKKCTADSHITIVRPSKDIDVDYFGLTLFNLEDYFTRMGVGATGQTELSRATIQNTMILVPPQNLQKEFSQIVSEKRRLCIFIKKEIKNLQKTRDLLIPKLITEQRGLKN